MVSQATPFPRTSSPTGRGQCHRAHALAIRKSTHLYPYIPPLIRLLPPTHGSPRGCSAALGSVQFIPRRKEDRRDAAQITCRLTPKGGCVRVCGVGEGWAKVIDIHWSTKRRECGGSQCARVIAVAVSIVGHGIGIVTLIGRDTLVRWVHDHALLHDVFKIPSRPLQFHFISSRCMRYVGHVLPHPPLLHGTFPLAPFFLLLWLYRRASRVRLVPVLWCSASVLYPHMYRWPRLTSRWTAVVGFQQPSLS